MKKYLLLIIPFFLSSCAIFSPTYTGETTADWLLKSDTESNINLIFRALHDCSPRNIHTQINNAKINPNGKVVDLVDETWTVTGCNQTEVFNVKFISDGQGGTYINITKKTGK